jgi:hypothetical protein
MTALTKTLAELRRDIGYMLGDVLELTATANGSTTTFIDSVRLGTNIERPTGRDMVFTSGTNLGSVRRVSNSDTSTGTLTFAAVTSTVAGDTAELYNFRSKGWTAAEYKRAINKAIDKAWPLFATKVTVSAAAAFSSTTTTIDVPSGIDQIESVEYQDTDSLWQEIPQAMGRYKDGWSVEADGSDVVIRGWGWRQRADSRSIRFTGYTRATALSADTDATAIPPEWLCMEAASQMCLSATDRDTNNYNKGLLFREDADKLKGSIRTRRKGRPVMVSP